MLYSQSPPLAEKEWLTAEETSSGAPARNPDARSDQRIGRRRMKPSIDPPHPYRFGEGQLASGRPSIGRRIFRTLTRFTIAVLIGVGATLDGQTVHTGADRALHRGSRRRLGDGGKRIPDRQFPQLRSADKHVDSQQQLWRRQRR